MRGLQHSYTILIAAVVMLAAVPHATAQAPAQAPSAAPQVQELMRKFPTFGDFEKNGGFVEYLGRSNNLDGFVLVSPDHDIKTVYVTPEGAMVMGILVDQKGDNLTAQQLQAYRKRLGGDQSAMDGAESGSLSKSEQVYAATEKTAWVKVGDDSAPYVYMFMNVNCDHCKAMFTDLLPVVKAGRLQVRLVPFGSADANRDGGAALLSVKDPLAAWQAYIKGDAKALDKGKITAGALDKIAANTQFATENKLQGPPFTLYRRTVDGVVTAMIGRPKNTMVLMADLLPPNLPPPPQADTTGGAP